MATQKKNVAMVEKGNMVELTSAMVEEKNTSFESMSLEDVLLRLESLDKVSTQEKAELINVFIVKAANVLTNEKKVERINKCYATLCKLNDKKPARNFEKAFIVLSSDWTRAGKKLVTVTNSNTVQFDKDGKLNLIHCNDIEKFTEQWNFHKQAIKFNQTNPLAYISGVTIEKQAEENTLDATKKELVKLYKKGNLDSKKFLADFMREKGIDIPTF